MGLLSSKIIGSEQLNPGDHIYTWRHGYSYSHHGIFVGDGKVIHLTRAPGPLILSSSNDESSPSHPSGSDRVVCCSLEEFLSGGDLYRFEYGVKTAIFVIKRGGTCTRFTSDPPTDVLHRASILLEKGFGDYHLFKNNCEDFALYCKTGLLNVDRSFPSMSEQIQFLFVIFFVVYFTPYQFLLSRFSCVVLLVVYGLVYCLFRMGEDNSFEKVAVEQSDLWMENGSRRKIRSFGASYYLVNIIIVFIYWRWTPASGILLWIRFFVLCSMLHITVYALLENHRKDLKLGEYVGVIIWLIGYWYCSSESSTIYFWTKLSFLHISLLYFVSDPQKLRDFVSRTATVHILWYWTPKSTILVWIRSLLLINFFLYCFVPDHLRNSHPKVYIFFFFACLVIQSASIFLGLDYGDYLFRITKSIFYL